MSSSRYIIGVDLGTSNCALAYIDTLNPEAGTQLHEIEQRQTEKASGPSKFLPSFLYLAKESADDKPARIVGHFAKKQLSYLPGRVVQSAKSWLAHQDSLGSTAILPWGSDEIKWQDKVSAVDASAQYLRHLAECWDNTIGVTEDSYKFERQRVIITVPASFTEDAQGLTLEAARKAGYPADVRLLEEPQAALYNWLESRALDTNAAAALSEVFPDISQHPKRVLVCDVGGGTTDFSLFELKMSEHGLEIVRSKVSEHLLLGGDNIDLAIAQHLEPQLRRNNQPLSTAEWITLTAQCREAKESVLGEKDEASDTFHISIAGRGSSLFSSSRTASLPLSTLKQVVSSEFFPDCTASEKIEHMQADPSEIGLPSISVKAVTRHLASFLDGASVDGILYAGGSLTPPYLRERLTAVITSWMPLPPIVLESPDISESVARGAARFGLVLEKPKDIIHGGYPRSLYIEVEAKKGAKKLVCIVAKGSEVDSSVKVDTLTLKALVNQPIKVQPYYSTVRPTDTAGDLIETDTENVHPLPMLQTVLELPPHRPRPPHDQLQVRIRSSISETGLLSISCDEVTPADSEGHSWKLTFNVRKHADDEQPSEPEPVDHFELPAELDSVKSEINAVFGKSKTNDKKVQPKRLVSTIEKTLSQKRSDWHPRLLRNMWPPLERGMTRKGRSPAHESTWFYLAGFVLRPGYGTSLDSAYISQLWKSFSLGLHHPKEAQVVDQWYIMWRRVSGGLEQSKQEDIFSSVAPKVFNQGKSANLEAIRLLCSLERISPEKKKKVGAFLVKRIEAKSDSRRVHLMWELGRLCCRVPMYANTQFAVPPTSLMEWFSRLSDMEWTKPELSRFQTIFAQACRISGDRSVDLNLDQRRSVTDFMHRTGASQELTRMIETLVETSDQDKRMLFGEALPHGLKLAGVGNFNSANSPEP